jgi:hypothetical protein
VTFTIVAVDSSLVPSGSFSIALSDGLQQLRVSGRRERHHLLNKISRNRRECDAQSASPAN